MPAAGAQCEYMNSYGWKISLCIQKSPKSEEWTDGRTNHLPN